MLEHHDQTPSRLNSSNYGRDGRRTLKTVVSTVPPVATTLDDISIGKQRPHADEVKIIGGRNYDLRQPIPIKYQSVRNRFLQARTNFWTPSEINMGEDKSQWLSDELTENEAWLFKTNISYLTASDNLVPDNLDNALLAHITANEARQYLRWQIAEEANHLESYLFILESLGLDEQGQGQIFNLYQEIPELVNKLNWNLQFTNNLVHCDYPAGSMESNRAILEDLISYYIFEYLFFPAGFAQIFALARNGKLKNTAEQYAYIWRDENLHAANNLWLIRQIRTEYPQIWDAKLQEKARSMVWEAIKLETEYAKAVMPDGGVLGMSVKAYLTYAEFLGNRICNNLGISPLFSVYEHPMPWLSEFEINREANFFESRVKEYQVGRTLNWDS